MLTFKHFFLLNFHCLTYSALGKKHLKRNKIGSQHSWWIKLLLIHRQMINSIWIIDSFMKLIKWMLPFTFSCFRNQYQGASAGICDLLGNCLTLVHSCSTSTAMLSQMEWNDFHSLTLFQTPLSIQCTLTCNIWTTV